MALGGPARQALPAGAQVAALRRHRVVPVELHDDAGTGLARLPGPADLSLPPLPPFRAVRESRQPPGERGAARRAAGGGAGLPHDRGGVGPRPSPGGLRGEARGRPLVHGPGGAGPVAARGRRPGGVRGQGGEALRLVARRQARRGDLRPPDPPARADRQRAAPLSRRRGTGKGLLPQARGHPDHAPPRPQG